MFINNLLNNLIDNLLNNLLTKLQHQVTTTKLESEMKKLDCFKYQRRSSTARGSSSIFSDKPFFHFPLRVFGRFLSCWSFVHTLFLSLSLSSLSLSRSFSLVISFSLSLFFSLFLSIYPFSLSRTFSLFLSLQLRQCCLHHSSRIVR
jgi:hypothetical protein